MKKVAIWTAILLLLFLIPPWLMGFAIAERIGHLSEGSQTMLPQLRMVQGPRRGVLTSDQITSYELGSAIKVERHYHRGWFASVDEAAIDISRAIWSPIPGVGGPVKTAFGGEAERSPLHFTLRTVIHHGPVCGATCFALAGAETHLQFSGALRASLRQLYGNKEPLKVKSRLEYFGGSSAVVSSPPIQHGQTAEGTSLTWGGLDATVRYGARPDSTAMSGTAPELKFASAKSSVEFDDLSFSVHSKRVAGLVFAGNSGVSVKALSVAGADASRRFTVNDVFIRQDSDVSNGFMSMSYRLGTGTLEGAPLALSSSHLDISWKHLGIRPMESLLAAIQEANQDASTGMNPSEHARRMMTAVKAPLESLLLDAPEMDLDRLSIATAQGQGALTGSVRLVGFSAADLEMPGKMLPKLDVRLDLSVDEALLTSWPSTDTSLGDRLQPLIEQGYVTRDGGSVRTQLTFLAGLVSLNGKPFNMAALREPAPPPAPAPPALPPSHKPR